MKEEHIDLSLQEKFLFSIKDYLDKDNFKRQIIYTEIENLYKFFKFSSTKLKNFIFHLNYLTYCFHRIPFFN